MWTVVFRLLFGSNDGMRELLRIMLGSWSPPSPSPSSDAGGRNSLRLSMEMSLSSPESPPPPLPLLPLPPPNPPSPSSPALLSPLVSWRKLLSKLLLVLTGSLGNGFFSPPRLPFAFTDALERDKERGCSFEMKEVAARMLRELSLALIVFVGLIAFVVAVAVVVAVVVVVVVEEVNCLVEEEAKVFFFPFFVLCIRPDMAAVESPRCITRSLHNLFFF